MFICSLLEWAIYAYKCIYVYTYTHTLYAKCDQEAASSTANSDMHISVFFFSIHHLISLWLQTLTTGSAMPVPFYLKLVSFKKH